MATLTRAETERTEWRYDGTLPGIFAKIEDGVGRSAGFWVGDPGWGYRGKTVTMYVKGRNGQTSFSVELTPDEARRLAFSLTAMADYIPAETA